MNILKLLINIILLLSVVALVVSVLMQQGEAQGLGAISGGAETFFGKNKGRSYDSTLKRITKISAGVFIVCALLMALIPRFMS